MNVDAAIRLLDDGLREARKVYEASLAYVYAHPEVSDMKRQAAQHLRLVEQIERALTILERENDV